MADSSATSGGTRRLVKAQPTAEKLGISLPRLYELARIGLLPSVRLGRSIRFSQDAIDEFIRSGGKALDGPGGWRRAEGDDS